MIDGGHQYQWLTAYDRQRMEGHRLDWPGQPSFFKNYSPVTSYSLPLPENLPECSLFSCSKKAPSCNPLVWNRQSLATLLLLTSAPTARSSFAEGEVWYRSNASAGALHPLEFYISFPGAEDLPAGLYHYDLLKPALNRLRHDPCLEIFATACGQNQDGDSSWPTLFVSAIFFRSAWKYRARAYRYLLLDAGHALENLILALQAMDSGFEVVLDFDDTLINQALGLDGQREVGLVAVRLGSAVQLSGVKPKPCLAVTDPEPELVSSSRVSTREIDYPLLNEIHLASSVSLRKMPAQKQTNSNFYQNISGWREIHENIIPPKSALDYVESLRLRRSQRNFIRSETLIDLENLFYLLTLLGQSPEIISLPVPEIAFLASGVRGLNDGLYSFDPFARRLALVSIQDRRRAVAAASLDQRWLERAALQFVFFADLESTQELYGPRSYRYLQITAGRWGQRFYLGATALGLGCCAVGAFYDHELAKACCLPENCDPLYLLAVGPVAGSGKKK